MTRHALSTRLWHWANLACVAVLFMSGLNISNAHPRLYWGQWGFAPDQAWLHLPHFPGWMTVPGHYSLAQARLWHLFTAWPFAVGLIVFLVIACLGGHARRDLLLRNGEWRWSAISADIRAHWRGQFARPGAKFNLLQKIAYALILFLALPLMVATGLAMSPAMDAIAPWLIDLFGGRQSARSLHFLLAWGLVLFTLGHVALVLLTGPVQQLRAMITGQQG